MYSKDQYENAIKLRKDGLTYVKIAEILGIKRYNTVYDWTKNGKVPKGKFLVDGFDKLSPELGYILGVIEGDGYVSLRKTKGRAGLDVKDKDFSLEFKRNLETWSRLEASFRFRKDNGLYISTLYSLRAARFLKEFDISILINSGNKIKANFLRGFFDAEGCVAGCNLDNLRVASRFISCYNTNKELIIFIGNLLESIGISVQGIDRKISGGFKKGSIYYRLRIGGKENLGIFRDKVGFSIERKNKKLDEVLKSYEKNKDRWWSKEEKRYALEKSLDPKYMHQKGSGNYGVNNKRIAKELNRLFHEGRKIRTMDVVRGRLCVFRKEGNRLL